MLQTLGRLVRRAILHSPCMPGAELSVCSRPLLETANTAGGVTPHTCGYAYAACQNSHSEDCWQSRTAAAVDGIEETSTSYSTTLSSANGSSRDSDWPRRPATTSSSGTAGLGLLGSTAARLTATARGIHTSASTAAASPPSDGPGQEEGIVAASEEPAQVPEGAPFQSLEDFDETLERWEELLEEGDYNGVMALLQEKYGDVPGLKPLEEILAEPSEEEEDRAERRKREEQLKEQFSMKRTRLVDDLGRAYATGKRKCSVARVWIREPPKEREGLGRIVVNSRPLDDYFKVIMRRLDVLAPFEVTGQLGQFDVRATVTGGGTTGQAQAVRHGISKALQLWDPEFRPVLKAHGFLTRDARVVERKKPGKAKARKSFQWVKR